MTRQAILIGNKIDTIDERLSTNLHEVRKSIEDIKERLETIGTYSFNVEPVINSKYEEANTKVRSFLNQAATGIEDNENDCLLVYYFGHALVRNNDLYLIFKDSDPSLLSTQLLFSDIVRWASGFNIGKAIFILDCCYAGTGAYHVKATVGSGNKYALIASSIPTQKSYFLSGKTPLGVFSWNIFRGLRDIEAAQRGTRLITISSLFEYTKRLLLEDGIEQEPYSEFSGLGDFGFSKAEPTRVIDPRFHMDTFVKSFYRKIGWVSYEISRNNGLTPTTLYKIVDSEQTSEFLANYKVGNQTIVKPVQFTTFSNYLLRMKEIGILNNDEPLTLSN